MKTVKMNGKDMTSTKELGISELDMIAGGYVHYIHNGMWGKWEVIDDETGDVLSTECDLCHAEWACNKFGVSKAEIDDLGLKYLRKGIKGPKIGIEAY